MNHSLPSPPLSSPPLSSLIIHSQLSPLSPTLLIKVCHAFSLLNQEIYDDKKFFLIPAYKRALNLSQVCGNNT